jgi:hypothetical protein
LHLFILCQRPCDFIIIIIISPQLEIDIEPTDLVRRVKERVEEKQGIPPEQQRYAQFRSGFFVCHFYHRATSQFGMPV